MRSFSHADGPRIITIHSPGTSPPSSRALFYNSTTSISKKGQTKREDQRQGEGGGAYDYPLRAKENLQIPRQNLDAIRIPSICSGSVHVSALSTVATASSPQAKIQNLLFLGILRVHPIFCDRNLGDLWTRRELKARCGRLG